MNYEIQKTLRNRYKEILSRINNIWKLKKRKAEWRTSLEDVSKDIEIGLRGGSSSPYDAGTLAGAVGANKQRLKTIKNAIGKIRVEQNGELDKIKAIIEI